MCYRSASFILDKQEQLRNDAESRPHSTASNDMSSVDNPNANISMYYQARAAHHVVVTSDWLAQAEAAVAGHSDDAFSDNGAYAGEEKSKRFSVVHEFKHWRKQPDLAEALAAIRALRRSFDRAKKRQ